MRINRNVFKVNPCLGLYSQLPCTRFQLIILELPEDGSVYQYIRLGGVLSITPFNWDLAIVVLRVVRS
jgi:hypothetical protein